MIGLSIAIDLIKSTSRNEKGNGDSETGTSKDGVKQIGQSRPKRSISDQRESLVECKEPVTPLSDA